MKKILLLLLPLLLFSCGRESDSFIDAAGLYNIYNVKENVYDATIVSVYDGDTLTLKFDYDKPKNCVTEESVRLIGIDAPEMYYYTLREPEYYAIEAKNYLSSLVGKSVLIEFDDVSSLRDSYNNLLAYVWVDSKLLNKSLIEQGYAKYYSANRFNSDRMASFASADEEAQRYRRGMWGD